MTRWSGVADGGLLFAFRLKLKPLIYQWGRQIAPCHRCFKAVSNGAPCVASALLVSLSHSPMTDCRTIALTGERLRRRQLGELVAGAGGASLGFSVRIILDHRLRRQNRASGNHPCTC